MVFIREASEDEMILEFLKGEITSVRFGEDVKNALEKAGADESLVFGGDLSDRIQNELRRKVLGICRGYPDREIFENYPQDVEWSLVRFDTEDIDKLRYIDYSYWNELSSGSSKPTDAALNVRKGVTVFNVPNDGFLSAADAIGKTQFPPLIALTCDDNTLLLLEGHVRATAYALKEGSLGGTFGYIGRCTHEAIKKKEPQLIK